MSEKDHRISTGPDGKSYPIPTERDIAESLEVMQSRAERMRGLGRKVIAVQGLGFVGAAAAAVIADTRGAANGSVWA